MRCNLENFASQLRKCTSISEVRQLHSQMRTERSQNTYHLNLLVQLYGNFGCVQQAWDVFSSMGHENRNIFSWNIMLAAFAKSGYPEQLNSLVHNGDLPSAGDCFNLMPQTNVLSWNSMVSAYAFSGDLQQARLLLSEIPERNVDSWNPILQVQAQNGDFLAAANTFQRMKSRNLISWTGILTGYAKNGELQHARLILMKMPSWDSICWNVMISGFLQHGEVDAAETIFLSMPHRNSLTWNSMIYSREIRKSEAIFRKMPQRNTFSWNSMLAAYAENDQLEEAEKIFEEIPDPNTVTRNSMIQAYSLAREPDRARIIFDMMPERDVIAWNSLLGAFAQSARLSSAENLFSSMPSHDSISCNIMLAAFSDQGRAGDAKQLFNRIPYKTPVTWNTMIQLHPENAADFFTKIPWRSTFSCSAMIQACGDLGDSQQAIQIFKQTIPAVHRDLIVWNGMISTMCQLDQSEPAREIFERAPSRNSYSYTILIQALILKRRFEEARSLLREFPEQSPISCSIILNACLQIGELEETRTIFHTLLRNRNLQTWNLMLLRAFGDQNQNREELFNRMPHQDEVSWNSLMSSYAQAGEPDRVEELFAKLPDPGVVSWNILLAASSCNPEKINRLFHQMPERDTVSWNTAITALARSGHHREALELFKLMDLEGAAPDEKTLVAALEFCSGAAAAYGSIIHRSAIEAGFPLGENPSFATALLSMYGRSGRVEQAELVFNSIQAHDSISWTSMIGVYCSNGLPEAALEKLWEMEQNGLQADQVSFLAILSGCSHAGMFCRGWETFSSMVYRDLELQPDHYACMVDLLARAGLLELAEELAATRLSSQTLSWITSLLTACGSQSDPERAARISKLAPESSSARYVLLSNVHTKP